MKAFKYLLAVMTVVSQQTIMRAQDYKIPVQNSKDGKLILGDFKGNLTIEGYSGNEIVIASPSSKTQDVPEKAKGLKPINSTGDNTGLGLNVQKNGNQVTISSVMPFSDDENYNIRVPDNFSVKIGSVGRSNVGFNPGFRGGNDSAGRNFRNRSGAHDTMGMRRFAPGRPGNSDRSFLLENILIKNMKSEVEVSSIHSVKLENVTGPVVVATVDGDVNVSFTGLNREKPTSITTVSGEVDITLPAKSPANLNIRTLSGNIYSDFDFPSQEKSESPIGSNLNYKLNGGGVDLSIVTVSGNVYLRKGK